MVDAPWTMKGRMKVVEEKLNDMDIASLTVRANIVGVQKVRISTAAVSILPTVLLPCPELLVFHHTIALFTIAIAYCHGLLFREASVLKLRAVLLLCRELLDFHPMISILSIAIAYCRSRILRTNTPKRKS